jgi:ribosomal protein S18 acetylase RimI-like enzyme
MQQSIEIRPYRPDDLAAIEALEARVHPYRPEDESEVQAMYARALLAKDSADPRWMGFPEYPERSLAEEFDAFWVAERLDQTGSGLVGTVGVQTFRAGDVISAHHPLARTWQTQARVAELRRLRVAPEARGQSLGTQLCQAVIAWSAERFNTLVVNTTTPQKPALQLYRKLGFRDVGLSYIDRYELVWLERDLS